MGTKIDQLASQSLCLFVSLSLLVGKGGIFMFTRKLILFRYIFDTYIAEKGLLTGGLLIEKVSRGIC